MLFPIMVLISDDFLATWSRDQLLQKAYRLVDHV